MIIINQRATKESVLADPEMSTYSSALELQLGGPDSKMYRQAIGFLMRCM